MNWQHFGIGPLVYLGARLAQVTWWQGLLIVIAVFIAHDIGDGDFFSPKGSFAKGCLEVLSALPLPVVCALVEWWI